MAGRVKTPGVRVSLGSGVDGGVSHPRAGRTGHLELDGFSSARRSGAVLEREFRIVEGFWSRTVADTEPLGEDAALGGVGPGYRVRKSVQHKPCGGGKVIFRDRLDVDQLDQFFGQGHVVSKVDCAYGKSLTQPSAGVKDCSLMEEGFASLQEFRPHSRRPKAPALRQGSLALVRL